MLVAGSGVIDFSESDANEENEFESEALTFAEADEAGQNEAGGHDNTGGGDGGGSILACLRAALRCYCPFSWAQWYLKS